MNRVTMIQEFCKGGGLAPLGIEPFSPSPCECTDVLEAMGRGVTRHVEEPKIRCRSEHRWFGIATAILVLDI
jgi:hypothetical protein